MSLTAPTGDSDTTTYAAYKPNGMGEEGIDQKPNETDQVDQTEQVQEEQKHGFKEYEHKAGSSCQGEDEYDDLSDESQEEVDELVAEDMKKLEMSFKGISQKYRLVNRIGEGTFSTVYKAEDLSRRESEDSNQDKCIAGTKRRRIGEANNSIFESQEPKPKSKKVRYVALKKIYVTSSPMRIQNELELLTELRGYRSVCPLITAFRCHDQVVAVLPYFPHADFRILYRTFMVADMRHYFRSLFKALYAVHRSGIIHRDIKPTNFLYNPELRRGVLVDFGLAEREFHNSADVCTCSRNDNDSVMIRRSTSSQRPPSIGYPKNDSRPSRRANRAGTRGFRAPEVLFKCTSQSTKIDIWSTGVILLTFIGRRFPFFNSLDDVEAMVEIASIFGTRRMKAAALLHGQIFETTIPTIGEKGYSWERIVVWSSCVDSLTASEKQATQLLSCLMELDPHKRLSAKQALAHPFFTNPEIEDLPWGGDDVKAAKS